MDTLHILYMMCICLSLSFILAIIITWPYSALVVCNEWFNWNFPCPPDIDVNGCHFGNDYSFMGDCNTK